MSKFVLDDRVLQRLIKESPAKVDKAIRATAFNILGKAVGRPDFPVDTGATRNSGFAQTSKGKFDENGAPFDEGRALGKNPSAELIDGTPGKPDPMTAYISFATNYAGWLELGTKKMPARPFLRPAMEKAVEVFTEYIKQEFGYE